MSLILSIHNFLSIHIHHYPRPRGYKRHRIVQIEMLGHGFEEFSKARVIIRIENVVFVLILSQIVLLYLPLGSNWLVTLIGTSCVLLIVWISSLILRWICWFLQISLPLTCWTVVVGRWYFVAVVDCGIWRSVTVHRRFLQGIGTVKLSWNGGWKLTFILHFVYRWQFVISGGCCLFGWLLALVLGLGLRVCVFYFDDGLEHFLVRVAAASILFVGSGVLLLLLGRGLLLCVWDLVVALGGCFTQHFHYFFVICLVWVLFLIDIYCGFAQNWLNHEVIGIHFLVLGWLLLGLSLVLVSIRDEQLLEIRGIGCVVLLSSANRLGRRDAWGLVIFLLHMDGVGRGLGLELAHQAGRYQVHSVFHLVYHFVRIHLLANILAWKSYGCIIILLLLLRVGLLQQRLMTRIMT